MMKLEKILLNMMMKLILNKINNLMKKIKNLKKQFLFIQINKIMKKKFKKIQIKKIKKLMS